MSEEVTDLLTALARDEKDAAARLLPLVYQELRRLARAQMARARPGQTLQPTALVHEAYLALVGSTDPGWNGRGHFFGAAARAMREILVDQARRRAAKKRGGGVANEPFEDDLPRVGDTPADELLAIDRALEELEKDDPRKAKIVEMYTFAGLTHAEIAEALGVTTRTVEREWRLSRALLHEALSG